jgi:glycosyltransferase involved in cell wall biosynthesis
MYNAASTLGRMLHSVYGQSYDNWHLFLIDDVSTHEQVSACKDIIQKFENIQPGKITVIWNNEKKWEVSNVLQGISLCNSDDIICRIDADDWLTDLDALAIINHFYLNAGCDTLWTSHRWGFSDRNISGPMPNGVDPYNYPWVSSHFKTFRKSLLNGVSDENYRGQDGQYIRRAGDQAVYLPALYNSKNRLYLPLVMYHYTINDVPETYTTPDAHFQKGEAEFLRQRGYVSDRNKEISVKTS